MIDLNLGDVATRIRRFTRAVGNLGIQLDQTASPVVVVANLDAKPYSNDPRFLCARMSIGNDAVHLPSMAVQAAPGTVLVVDAMWIEGQTTVQQNLVNICRNFSVATFAADFPTLFAHIPDVSSPTQTLTINSPQLGAALMGGSVSLSGIPGGFNLTQFPSPLAGNTNVLVLPEPIILFGGPVATPSAQQNVGDVLQVVGGAVNLGVAGTFWCREFNLIQGAV
jgi:hypothetical protein